MNKIIYSVRGIQQGVKLIAEHIIQSNAKKAKLLLLPMLDGGLMLFKDLCVQFDKKGIKYDYQALWLVNDDDDHYPWRKSLDGVWGDYFVVVIDDIFETGATTEHVTDMLLKGRGIGVVDLCCVFMLARKVGVCRFQVKGVNCFAAIPTSRAGWFAGYGMNDENFRSRGAREIWEIEKP